ncbi:DUF1707 domain-containing protein [Spirillospora sp. NPDC050679]
MHDHPDQPAPTGAPTAPPAHAPTPAPAPGAAPAVPPGMLRASDADRNTAIEQLGDALAEGALDTPEYNRRLEQAVTATTLGQLTTLTADLPVSRAALTKAENARKAAKAQADKREWRNEWGYWGGGALIMTAIWAINCVREHDLTFFWPVWPLGIWGAILLSYALWPDNKDS